MRRLIAAVAAVLIIALPSASFAQESGGNKPSDIDAALEGFEDAGEEESQGEPMDEVMEGFDDGPAQAEEAEAPENFLLPPWLSLTGFLTADASYNYEQSAPAKGSTDYRGLSMTKLKANAKLDFKLPKEWKARVGAAAFHDFAYGFKGSDKYTNEVLENYESEVTLKEAYVAGAVTTNMDLKAGRQIVVWGKSDNIRVTDVLNPLDNRQPGMVDIEDLREPLTMARLDYYFDKWSVTAIAIHEIKFNKNPVFGSDFYPAPAPSPVEITPDNTEYAAALNGVFSGYDVALYWADVYSDTPSFALDGRSMKLVHHRITMVGAAANYAVGDWLIKGEAARIDGLKFMNAPDRKFARQDSLVGVEYTGVTDTTLSFEIVHRHIADFDSATMAAPDNAVENEYQYALRYQSDFIHDTVHLTALVSLFGKGGEDGAFERISLAYDAQDALTITGGVLSYQSGDNPFFKNIELNDRLFINVKWSF